MSSGDVSVELWLNEYKMQALESVLDKQGTSVEERLQEHLIELYADLVPVEIQQSIRQRLDSEAKANRAAAEADRRFAVFHVTEDGKSVYFLAAEKVEMLHAAVKLRGYLRKPTEDYPTQFLGMFSRSEHISAEQFDDYVKERLDNTGRVTGAFDIDLDNGTFDALHNMEGWQRFRVQDVSTAVYYATKKSYASQEHQWRVFLERLDGKQLTTETEIQFLHGQRELRSEDISFSEDIMQNDHLLEFYMDVVFDADAVFGTQVCTSDNDDFMNIYANYDLERGCVRDTLEVYLIHGDGTEQDRKYRLSEEEQALLLPKMEEYCKRQFGCDLDELRSQYLSEQDGSQQSPQM